MRHAENRRRKIGVCPLDRENSKCNTGNEWEIDLCLMRFSTPNEWI